MQIRAQQSHQVEWANLSRSYDDGVVAILLMTSNDPAILSALRRVFEIHDAPFVSFDEGPDHDMKSFGDCILRPDGIKVVVEGSPDDGFMGMLFEVDRGREDRAWLDAIRTNGHAWLCVISPDSFQRIRLDATSVIPIAVRMLKLDAIL